MEIKVSVFNGDEAETRLFHNPATARDWIMDKEIELGIPTHIEKVELPDRPFNLHKFLGI